MDYQQLVYCSSANEIGIIKYYIVKRIYNHKRQKICYGICVERSSSDSESALESETAYNLSFDADVVLDIIGKLAKYIVTPISLMDVLDDMDFIPSGEYVL